MRRRTFLRSVGLTTPTLGLATACQNSTTSSVTPGTNPFQHGVASGDPLTDRVILWTRVSPEQLQDGSTTSGVEVAWWCALDEAGERVVASGSQWTNAERDFTVKVDAAGLDADQRYFYGFTSGGFSSPVGRTRTLPVGDVDQIAIAVTSCANHPQGFFNAYAHIAGRDDLNAVLSLGDYLYEYANTQYGDGTALGRVPEPNAEIVSLADYRARHGQYKQDSDLQAAHAAHPWIVTWDDHESTNNSWKGGAQNHNPENGEGDWAERKAVAIRAYYEWMPVREVPTGLYRSFRFGNLADLVMLDTRLEGRDEQGTREDLDTANDPTRSLLGPVQEERFLSHLSATQSAGVQWKLVGQQVVFAPLADNKRTDGKSAFNPDSWDGYRASRRRVLEHIAQGGVENTVILSGDVHSAWGMEVPDDGDVRRAVEFVAPAVSSPPLATTAPALKELVARAPEVAPHVRYVDGENNGYLVVSLNEQRAEAAWWFTGDRKQRSGSAALAQTLGCDAGDHTLS